MASRARARVVSVALAVALAGTLGAAMFRPGPAEADATGNVITVYKSPSCGCCTKWVEYLRANGFEVKTVDVDDLSEVKTATGVPASLQTCHTGVIKGYVIEGHVPVDAIRRLLAGESKLAGIAVPGMPAGSPGMEVPGTAAQPYQIIAWDKTGKTSVFAKP